MQSIARTLIVVLSFCVFPATGSQAQEDVQLVQIIPDVVYGHKAGMALTFDVFRPTNADGAAVLQMVSGGWRSAWRPPERAVNGFRPLLSKGFTVLSIRHGSSPQFLVPEAVEDVRRAVRYIRLHADEYGIDPGRMGVWGGSAGGHLSLVLGTTSDEGKADERDEVERTSNRVAAVVAYYPPTDLSHFFNLIDRFPALDFERELSESVSPIFHVSPDDPPTLLIHGDEDTLVPIGESEAINAEFQKHGVASKFITIEGAGHGFSRADGRRAMEALVAWFEEHLRLE